MLKALLYFQFLQLHVVENLYHEKLDNTNFFLISVKNKTFGYSEAVSQCHHYEGEVVDANDMVQLMSNPFYKNQSIIDREYFVESSNFLHSQNDTCSYIIVGKILQHGNILLILYTSCSKFLSQILCQ